MAATTTISLELEEPRIRREAFPWGAADVEMCADLRVARAAATATRVHLPSVVDLSTLQQPHVGDPATTGGNRVEEIKLLEVEVLGCDLGITFTLGTAIVDVPLKLKPSLAQNACRSDPFRASVTDDAGARIGTLSGAFIARRQDHVALRGGGEAKASEDRSCSAGGVGQEWPPEGDGMPGQQVKVSQAFFYSNGASFNTRWKPKPGRRTQTYALTCPSKTSLAAFTQPTFHLPLWQDSKQLPSSIHRIL